MRDDAGLSTELEKAKERIEEIESVEAINIRRHEELMKDDEQRIAEEVSVWKEIFGEDEDRMVNDVEVATADSVKMSIEQKLVLAPFEKHVRALQVLVSANVERKVTLNDAMTKIWELHESGL